jgi:EAL domain-containing protein (putative c-di-GMP-specific phosphodiesterase class I)/GGDEF domain-containing protein/CHASE3 domain sensor protein
MTTESNSLTIHKPRRLGWRLTLGFGLLLVLMLLALALAGLQIRAMTVQTQRFATEDMQRLLRVQALSLYTEGASNALLRLMNAPRQNRVEEYAVVDDRNRRMDGIVASLADQLDDPQQEQTLQRLVTARAAYFTAFLATVDEVEGDNSAGAMRAFTDQVRPALAEMLAASNALVNRERERIEQQAEAAQRQLERLALWVTGLSALAVALAAWLAWRTTRSVVNPLAQLEAAALRIAGGDYTNPSLLTSAVEVNRVGQALSTMTGAIATREREIERLAFRDPLTNLPNRTFLLEPAARRAIGNNVLMMLDLARLKTINETLGFATGDTLINEAAERLSAVVKAGESDGSLALAPKGRGPVLAHLSGGRFAVSFFAPDRPSAERLHAQVLQSMAESVVCSGHSVDLSWSVGLADSPVDAPLDAPVLMRNAEIALHAAKRAARDLAWYSEAQEAARLSHLGLLSDLRAAVADAQLQMWLQPKFSLRTGQAVGVEALVRWQHPQRGFVSPAEFVPFAEQTGYIGLVTHWMLEQAVQTLAAWAPLQPSLSIAVNISTRDLRNPQFCADIQTLLTKHSVNPERLRLEIVESGLMEDPQSSIAVLQGLRFLGVQLSIDDFGTGYSSLAYLQTLPVSELKIDRSFVDRIDQLPGTQRLFRTMVEMGHGMGLMVTAEGVETEAERATITQLGCDVMQGYLGSRPLHGAALQAWFEQLPTHQS